MFDSKSKLVKAVGYFIMGFFGLIIVISFGMPDFVSKLGLDNTTVAIVNGEKIHAFDYYRFRDRYKDLLSKESSDKQNMENTVFRNFIGEILILQKAKDLGIDATEERILRYIRGMQEFQNQATGRFDMERYRMILRQTNMSTVNFTKMVRNSLMKEDLFRYLQMGTAVSPDDINIEYTANNSKIQIKYAYLARNEMEKRFSGRINVTESEITEDLGKNPGELKDPNTDRLRIKDKLKKKKLDESIKGFVADLNSAVEKNGDFNMVADLLKGMTGESKVFKMGDEVLDNKGKEENPLTDISNSMVFRESCLSLKKGASSKVIESGAGLYIFTPVMLDVNLKKPGESDYASLERIIGYEMLDAITRNMMTSLSEKSKIVKNLKTD